MPETDLLDKIVNYISSNYMDSITIGDLERVAGMSRFAISRKFQRAFQVSPMRWVWRFRVNTAANLLVRYPGVLCRDIGYSCGFETPSHFCRLFSGALGCSPSLFRKKRADYLHAGLGRDSVTKTALRQYPEVYFPAKICTASTALSQPILIDLIREISAGSLVGL